MQKILIVDDEQDICEFVRNFFQERGYEVLIAPDGEQALELTKKNNPELVLLDIKMKGMDGIATLKHIKELNKNQKVIMVTALDNQDKIAEACKLGACEYITKPLILDHLEQTVEKILQRSL